MEGSDSHKIVAVLRLRTGDEIEIFDSAAREYRARLNVEGRNVRAELLEQIGEPPDDALQVTVAQGIPKGQKMDFAVEKLTELGAREIVPLQSERTIAAQVAPSKLDRWRRLAKTAAQQCGRADVPQITQPRTLRELCGEFNSYDVVLLPWEGARSQPLREQLPALLRGARRILLIIGPEGGFSGDEAETAQGAGAHAISLGPRILRTETAALVALSILSFASGV